MTEPADVGCWILSNFFMFRAVACVLAGPVTPPMINAMTRVTSVQSIQRNIATNSKLKMLAARAVVMVYFFRFDHTKMQYNILYCSQVMGRLLLKATHVMM